MNYDLFVLNVIQVVMLRFVKGQRVPFYTSHVKNP